MLPINPAKTAGVHRPLFGVPYVGWSPRPAKNGQPTTCTTCIPARKVGGFAKKIPLIWAGPKTKEQILQKWDPISKRLVNVRCECVVVPTPEPLPLGDPSVRCSSKFPDTTFFIIYTDAYTFVDPAYPLRLVDVPLAAPAWSAGTSYALNDIVERDEQNWLSVIDENVGNIPQALLVAWTPSIAYVVGNVRYYTEDNNSYQCILAIPESLGLWSPGTSYALNDIVERGDQTWRSQIDGNVGNIPQELLDAWTASIAYVVGNVRYHTYEVGGDEVTNAYRCIEDISGSLVPPSTDGTHWASFGTGSDASGVWAVVEPPSTDGTHWESFGTGSDASGVWAVVPLDNPSTLPANDAFVEEDGFIGLSSVPTSLNPPTLSGKPFDVVEVTTRQLLVDFLNKYFQYLYDINQSTSDIWSDTITYNRYDTVVYAGRYYRSLVDNNSSVIPSAVSESWADDGVVGEIPLITASIETHLTLGTPNVLTLRISAPLAVESAGIYFGYNSRGPYTFGLIPPYTGEGLPPIASYYGLVISRGNQVVQATYPIACD